MNAIEKTLLTIKLKAHNIKFDDLNLDEVLESFDRVCNIYLEEEADNYVHPRSFIYMPNSTYDREEQIYFEVFCNIMVLIRLDLYKYLDYAIIHHYYHNLNVTDGLSALNFCIKSFLGCQFQEPQDKSFCYRLLCHEAGLIKLVSIYELDRILKSKFISNDYKEIIVLYHNIFARYQHMIGDKDLNDLYRFPKPFANFMDITYFYFLEKELLQNNQQEVLNFLKMIDENLVEISDEINLNGEMDYPQTLEYIDYLYNKEKNEKTIR